MHKTEKITIVANGQLQLDMTVCQMSLLARGGTIHPDLIIEDARVEFSSDICFCDEGEKYD